jgi:hypothetical protein
MPSTWVEALSSPAVSAGIGALAGLGGGWLVTRGQQKQQQDAERERRREATAQAVGPVLSIMVGAQLVRAGPGPGELHAYWSEWEGAWSAHRERLLIMTVGHRSERVNHLGLDVARLIPEWLEALRRYDMAAQELSQVRRSETHQRVLDDTEDHDAVRTEADKSTDIRLDDEPTLADSKAEVVAKWAQANLQVRELLKAVREEQ